MDPQAAERFFTEATRQDDRWPAALEPGFAKADDRSLFELIDFASRFASQINYYSLDNRVDGDWVEFFTRDPLVTMASIAGTDLRSAERRLARMERLTRAASSGAREKRFRALLDAALELPRQTNRWLIGLSSPFAKESAAPLRAALESRVRGSLRAPLSQLVRGNPIGLTYGEFAPAWRLGDDSLKNIYAGGSVLEQIDAALPEIRRLWQPFPEAIGEWAALSRPNLSKAFEGGESHEPHIALLAAFARIFSSAQESINGLAGRRTSFYFRRILRETPKPAVPDTVHLAVACASDVEPGAIVVPAGTPFSAGRDAEGREIVFASQDALPVTSAALRRAFTVRVVSGPISEGIDQIVTQRVLAREVDLRTAAPEGWSTFGSASDAPADIGFAVSSPVLGLAGGERTITLTLRYDAGTSTAAALKTLSASTGLPQTQLLQAVFLAAFALDVSTGAGWFPVPAYAVAPPQEEGDALFRLRFTLSGDVPAVIGIPGSGVAWPHPAVRASLRQDRVSIAGPRGAASVYPLSVLEGLRVRRADVAVDVIALRGVRVSTVHGDVDQSMPFTVFGAVPTAGSALRLRHPELFSKTVERLVIHIKWYDLPKHGTGFHGYFRGYVLDQDGNARAGLFDNQVFRAAVTTERPGWWELDGAGDGDRRYLFRTNGARDWVPGKDEELSPQTSINDLVVRPLAPPSSDYLPAEGGIRVELAAPDYAFGHTLYQQNMLRAAMASAPSDAACDASCRDQYKVLTDTRRHLEALSKELRRKRPLAAIGRATSPRFWASLPLRGANATYQMLTRSLPAYAERRPDAAPRSASVISVYYGDDGVPEPAPLPLLDRQASRRMVAARFDMALRSLLNEADACLASCISERKDRVAPPERRRLQQRLVEAVALHGSDRLRSLRDLHAQLQPSSVGDGDATRELLARCETMLEAAAWVDDCRSGAVYAAGWSYWRSVHENLVKCTAALGRLYDEAIPRCKEVCLRPKSRPLPNPPYVPQVEALTIDYSASGQATFAHTLPFGCYSAAGTEPLTLLPQWAASGSLYIGFSEGASVPVLRLYVQLGQRVRATSAPPPVAWDALIGTRWTPLDVPPAADATFGLQRSGIVSLPVPAGDAGSSTVVPAELRWFRATVQRDVDALPKATAILPHAVVAVRQISGVGATDPARAIAANSIRGPVTPFQGIGPIAQPAPSFGGRPAESERGLYLRISERLRHKDRAVQSWDYERLVLERFPDIWMVRVIPARRPRPGDSASCAAGHVRVVVVPGKTYPGVTDATAPAATSDTLAAIAGTLQSAAGLFVTVHVLNPIFVRLKVDAVVQWRKTVDAASSADRLNAALIQYLSPWRTDAPGGTSRTAADVEAFVRSWSDIELLHTIRFSYDADHPAEAEAEPERCLVTSAARHDIRTVAETALVAVAGY